jgi:hypothetical protein
VPELVDGDVGVELCVVKVDYAIFDGAIHLAVGSWDFGNFVLSLRQSLTTHYFRVRAPNWTGKVARKCSLKTFLFPNMPACRFRIAISRRRRAPSR